jgi:uncharacterized YigZ family protein
MYQLERMVSIEEIVKKSRFLATAIPIADEAEAKAALASLVHAEASHNCWAWRIGQAYRFSDDGEPSGTAGKPILSAIDGQSVDRVLVVVTRWFGGVLLGTGGLIRAYGGAAAICLRSATLVPIVETISGTIAVQFSDLARLKARLASFPALSIQQEVFTATGAELEVSLPVVDLPSLSALVVDLTSGRSSLKVED